MDERVKEYIVLRELVETVKRDLELIQLDGQYSFKAAVCRAVGSILWRSMRTIKQDLRREGVWIGPLQEERYARTCQVTQRGHVEVLRIMPAQLQEWVERRAKQCLVQIYEQASRANLSKANKSDWTQ